VELASDIAPIDITVVWSGHHLILKINGTTDQITLDNTMDNNGDYERIEQVSFADGTVWSHTDLLNQAMLNNGGNDTFYGGPESDTISGGAGADILLGNAGDDRIDGGSGNDTLQGGVGNDTYLFGRGYGQDVIRDDIATGNRAGFETVELAADIATSDITVVWSGNHLILKINGTADQITLDNTMDNNGDYERIEQVRFADGTIWSHAELLNQAMLNNGGNDIFYGGPESESILGGAGNDTLLGNAGNDTLDGGAGTGNDVLNGGAGTDTVSYASATSGVTVSLAITTAHNSIGAGSDTITATENLTGSAFADTLTGSTGANVIAGGDGDDIITGGAGNDTINGGLGADTLRVAGAMATYTLATVNGQVTLTDTATTTDGNDGTDTLIGVETIQFKDQSMGITSPIILDLNGDGVQTISASRSHARFDMNGDGQADDTSWISRKDGFLFLDRDHNGTLTNIGEMSFVGDLPDARTDLDGLKAFDSNGDGLLSADDAMFSEFRVWRDGNGDGRVGRGEVLSLTDIGLASISLDGTAHNSTVNAGDVAVVNTGTWTRTDGATLGLADAAMTYFRGQGPVLNPPSVSGLAVSFDDQHLRGIEQPSWIAHMSAEFLV
jgi:Ca2+-binding RTX toxin-like protein